MVQHCYLITGANSGIGLEATRQLVQHLLQKREVNHHHIDDAHVYMLCRSEERARASMESLADAMQPQQEMLSFLKFDGGDDAQTIQKECLDKLPKDAIILGILLNAGGFGDAKDKVKKQLRADTPGKTPGACSIAQSNLIGHAILVHLLLKSGKITSETRIVASGSEAAFATPMNLEKSSFEGILTGTAKAGIPGAEYGWIKAILALYWAAFARHNADVFVVTVSPGSVPTTNLLSQGGVMPVLRGLSKMAMWVGGSHSEQDAAKRYLDALLGNQHEQQSGSFWASRKGYVKDHGDVLQSDLKSAKFVGTVHCKTRPGRQSTSLSRSI